MDIAFMVLTDLGKMLAACAIGVLIGTELARRAIRKARE